VFNRPILPSLQKHRQSEKEWIKICPFLLTLKVVNYTNKYLVRAAEAAVMHLKKEQACHKGSIAVQNLLLFMYLESLVLLQVQ